MFTFADILTTILVVVDNISSRLSRNSEAIALEFLENLERMFLFSIVHNDACTVNKSSTTLYLATRLFRVSFFYDAYH